MEQLFVARELFQAAQTPTGHDYSHKITRLHFFIDPFLDCFPDLGGIGEREPQVVHYHSDNPPYLVGFYPNRWRGRGRVFSGFCRLFFRNGARDVRILQANQRKIGDFLGFAVLQDDEIFRSQVSNGSVVFVCNDGIHLNKTHIYAEYLGFGGIAGS